MALLRLQGGYGVPADINRAIQLFHNATDLGSWRAPHALMLVRAVVSFAYLLLLCVYAWHALDATAAWRLQDR